MRTTVITGGTGAIGSALVSEFSRDSFVVFTYNSSEERANELAARYHARAVKCDVSDRAQVNALFSGLNVDVLINNAGISQIKLFTDTTDADWARMLGVNLTGAFNCSQEALKSMLHRKSGAIINISSVWGTYGASCEVAYSASKAGVTGMTKALAKEVGPSGITVNAIAPGVIDSPMNGHLSADELAELVDETPLCRLGTPEDVAQAARYLSQATFVTGQVLGVDGGFC